MTKTPSPTPFFVSLAFFLAVLVGLSGTAAAQPATRGGHPAWLHDEPLVVVGNWDSMPIFMTRRRGEMAPWQKEQYRREHEEETVRKLKEAGVSLAIIHFYKGFGLDAEKEHMQDAKRLAELCHQHGIRVGVYVGSTIAYETFLLEKPEAESWLAPDYRGEPVIYGDQSFRRRPYFMHPGYVEYMKKVVTIAVQDFKADLIHFDNTSLRARRAIFHHPLAKADFRSFLQARYTPETANERVGFSDFRYVEPPVVEQPLSVIEDPLYQDWTDFRCRQLENFYRIMTEHIHSLNPQVAVDNNPHSGLSGINTMWEQAVDYPGLLRYTDVVWTEEGNPAGVSDDRILVSKLRSFKQATALGNQVFTYTSESPLQMAEAMVFNRQCIGMVGGIEAGSQLNEQQRSYIRFFRDHFNHFRNVEGAAEVAVLHSYSTMAFSNDRPYQSTYLFEQALIQGHIPFDELFDADLSDLGRYRVVVLADQEALGESKLDELRKYVRNGGGLVVTGLTSLYDEPRIPRLQPGLADLLKLDVTSSDPLSDAYRGRARQSVAVPKLGSRNEFGKGRVAYLPEVKPALAKPPGEAMNSRYWKLPLNAAELTEAVRWTAGIRPAVEVDAPDTVVTELLRESDSGNLLLHLLNYDFRRTPTVGPIQVRLRVPTGKSIAGLQVLSPDAPPKDLEFRRVEGGIAFTIDRLQVYNLVVATQ